MALKSASFGSTVTAAVLMCDGNKREELRVAMTGAFGPYPPFILVPTAGQLPLIAKALL
jgi:hypothetical protein